MSDLNERIDIYDINREKTGRTRPRHGEGSKLVPGEFMIYVLALLENERGGYLITRRTLDKKWAPGQWEIPGGGVSAGETSREAVSREALEETGIDVSGLEPVSVYTYINEDAESGDNYFCDIYHFKKDFKAEDVRVQEDEVLEWRDATASEIRDIQAGDGFLHYERIREALENEG